MKTGTAIKPAYELGCISIGFFVPPPLGDSIIAKKLFEAIITLEPNCRIDLFCVDSRSLANAKAFYGGNKNLNLILNLTNDEYSQEIKKYDLVLQTGGWTVLLISVNVNRLQTLSPKLFQGVIKVDMYNKKYMFNREVTGRLLFHMARARILKINRYTQLSCGGALPIYDNKVEINLLPEWKREFKKLGLKKYITVGSNGGAFNRHLVKEWPTRYYTEFISLLKNQMPDITVVQTGGSGVIKLENADKHLLGTDLELTKYILKNSLLHIDCEGGPVHLASQLGTKCIVLFGAIDLDYLKFTENINIVSEICSPCYGVWDNDQACLRGTPEPLCMLSITPQKVFELAYRYLKSLE